MTTTRHRIASLVLSALLACSSLPTAALAEARDEVVTDESIESVFVDSEPEVNQEGDDKLEETALIQEETPRDDLPTEEGLSLSPYDVGADESDGEGQEPGIAVAESDGKHADAERDADRVETNPELPEALTTLAPRKEEGESNLESGTAANDKLSLQVQSIASFGYVPYENCIWPSEAHDYIYFVSSKPGDTYGQDYVAYRYDVRSQSTVEVGTISKDSNSINPLFYTDDTLYAYENKWEYDYSTSSYARYGIVHIFDLTKDTASGAERTVRIDMSEEVQEFGVDHAGRMYVQCYSQDGNLLRVLDSSGNVLASQDNMVANYGFVGFDSSNGNFYFMGYYNWRYWGYDHSMTALKVGRFDGNTIVVNDKPITIAYQNWFFEHAGCAEMMGGRYLADLSPFNGDILSVLDSHAIDVNAVTETGTTISLLDSGVSVTTVALPEETIVLSALTHASEYENDVDKTGVGPRVSYLPSDGMVAVATGRQELSLYNLATRKNLGRVHTSQPIYKVMTAGSTLAILELDPSGNFSIESASLEFPTSINITGPSSVQAGGAADYVAQLNGNVTLDTTITSSDSSVLSVDAEGHASAWKAGQVTLTATTDTGLKTTLPVAVTARSGASATSKVVSAKGGIVSNWNAQDYRTYGRVVDSYLVETGSGLVRVQARESDVLIEYYDDAGNVKKTQTIKNALPLFGGYYHSRDGSNYLVFGQENSAQSDSTVILRVTRYGSDWSGGVSCDIRGINTYIPFDAGSLRMDEAGGKLYIHTCHEMYDDGDGYHHQANMTFVLQESNMQLVDSYTGVMNLSEGYVSHSFNQFIRTDGSYAYRVDQGDSYPRGIAFTRTPLSGTLANPDLYGTLKGFKDNGYNYTGASLGGFELSDSHAIVIWNEDASTSTDSYDIVRNVFVTSIDKNGGSAQTCQLTQYQSGTTCSTPQLVKLDERHFLAMWSEYDYGKDAYTMGFAHIDQAGQQAGPVVRKRLPQSDCQPILLSDGGVGWFVSSEKAVKLYRIDPFALEAMPEDPFSKASMCRREMRDADVSNVGMVTWTGKPFTPKPVVTMDGKKLVEGTDYKLSYSDNINMGWATITITGIGAYKDSISTFFYIDALHISNAAVSLSKTSYTFDGKAKKPTVTVMYGSQKLGAGSYDVSYAAGRKNVGKYKVTVTGKGNFWGSEELTFQIKKAANPMVVKAQKKTVKAAKVKKKAQVVAPLAVTKAKGTKAFKVTKWVTKKAKKYLSVKKSTGKITVKKGTPKGTYKLKVKVTAKGNANYKAKSKTVTVVVIVK